jgi:predicted O-linked N-acetylglucosamine transferase (SPINDLY family)
MSDDTITQILQQAIVLHQAGQLPEAQNLYLAILNSQPDHPDVHHNLGMLAMQVQQPVVALNHFKQALASNSQQAKFWCGYIQALIQVGQYCDARQVLKQGLAQVGLQGIEIDKLIQKLEAPAAEEIGQIVASFNQGRYLESESNARVLIDKFPDHGVCWKVLGLSLQRQGHLSEALIAMQKAVDLIPDDAEALINYAVTLHEHGLLPEAIAYYRQALHIDPENTVANTSLAVMLHNLGLYAEAESYLYNALELAPNPIDALINLALNLQTQGRAAEAETYFRQAINFNPNVARLHHLLSIDLKIQGRLSEAAASCQQALVLEPNYSEAHSNLGAIFFDQRLFAEAEVCFSNAIAFKPDYAEAHNNLGTIHQIQRQLVRAESDYRQAIALNPNYFEAHTNLGINLQSQGQVAEAESCWRTSLKLNPNQVETQSGLVFHLSYSACQPDSHYLNEARKYGKMVADLARQFTSWGCNPKLDRLRVGLVSGDFRNHPVGHFLHGLLRDTDKTRIEFIAYATQPGTDEFSALIKPYFVDWKNIGGISDEATAQLIHADDIHILIDVSGHSSHNRLPLFAWKPAPIQVSWLGYLASTGVGAIDYILSDSYSILPEDEKNFSEAIWRMPESCICFTPPNQSLAVAELPVLNEGVITFGSFNNLTKVTNAVISLWSRLLHSIPDSRLFLKASQLNEPVIRARTIQRFAEHGINVERLILMGTVSSPIQHLEMYNKIDIALDTFPYPGVTTSVEALWMGVPILTLQGDGILARAGESININAGLSEWIAADEADYINKAVEFSGKLTELAELRKQLRAKVLVSPIFNSVGFAKNFEDSLWKMWLNWRVEK